MGARAWWEELVIVAPEQPIDVNRQTQPATLAVCAAFGTLILYLVLTGGRGGVERSTRLERAADGSSVLTIDEKVSYGISGRLTMLAAKALAAGP